MYYSHVPLIFPICAVLPFSPQRRRGRRELQALGLGFPCVLCAFARNVEVSVRMTIAVRKRPPYDYGDLEELFEDVL